MAMKGMPCVCTPRVRLLPFPPVSAAAAAAAAAECAASAGITVAELQRYATSQSLTVPLGAMPGYADLTIGGLLATGAHGFGGKGNSNVVSEAAATCIGVGAAARLRQSDVLYKWHSINMCSVQHTPAPATRGIHAAHEKDAGCYRPWMEDHLASMHLRAFAAQAMCFTKGIS
jgi:hypothetical protein